MEFRVNAALLVILAVVWAHLTAAEPVAALRPAASQVDPLLAAPPVREEVVYVDETGAPLLGPSATTRRHDDDDERHHDDDHEDDDHRDGGDRDHDDD